MVTSWCRALAPALQQMHYSIAEESSVVITMIASDAVLHPKLGASESSRDNLHPLHLMTGDNIMPLGFPTFGNAPGFCPNK